MKSLALTVSSLAVGLGLGSITPWVLRCPPLEDSISLKIQVCDYTAQQKNFFLFARDISTVLGYIRCADSENGLLFAELALVFEIYPLH